MAFNYTLHTFNYTCLPGSDHMLKPWASAVTPMLHSFLQVTGDSSDWRMIIQSDDMFHFHIKKAQGLEVCLTFN